MEGRRRRPDRLDQGAEGGAPVHDFVYGITNGLFDPSRASLLVRGQKDYINPPTATDDVAKPKRGEASTVVDALANDTDIDSDPATLKIVEVLSPNAKIVGSKVQVTILDHPYTAPYVIEDEDGAKAMAVIHVPRGTGGTPFVVEGSVIEMDKDATKTVRLGDYVKSPQARTLGITSASTISAAPAANLRLTAEGGSLNLTSSGGYVGPASVMFEVTDQMSDDQKDVHTAYVSVPVQIGPKVPLLRCPTTAVTVLAGGLPRALDIPTLCRAWLPVGMSMDDVAFTSDWEREAADVELKRDGTGDRVVTLSAGSGARSGKGTLKVGVKGSDITGIVNVTVLGDPSGQASVDRSAGQHAAASTAPDHDQRAPGGREPAGRHPFLPRLAPQGRQVFGGRCLGDERPGASPSPAADARSPCRPDPSRAPRVASRSACPTPRAATPMAPSA